MNKVFKTRQIKSPLGLLFQIPVWLVAIFGLYKIGEMVFYSFTDFNMIESPSFVGIQNYIGIFQNEVTLKYLSNTVFLVGIVALLLIITAVLPAIFTARLRLPFGLAIMGAFSLISISFVMPGIGKYIFSSDSYGFLNGFFIGNSDKPILFSQEHAMAVAVIIMWFICLAPVFSITYIAARMKHTFLGTAISICAIPVLMYACGHVVTGIVGYPSMNYSADWIYTGFIDYASVRFEVGFGYAFLIIGLLMLLIWCAAVCLIVFAINILCKNISSDAIGFKIIGIITFAFSVLFVITLMYFITAYFLNAFKPLDEVFILPHRFFPQRLTLKNFSQLFQLMGGAWVPLSRAIYNSLVAIPLVTVPVCFLVALPSGFGFSTFKILKRQELLLLPFIAFLPVSLIPMFIVKDSYFSSTFNFIGGFEFLISVFIVYLVVKLIVYKSPNRWLRILIGSLCIFTSFISICAIRGIFEKNDYIYSEQLKNWYTRSSVIISGGIARINVAAANDLMMLLVTVMLVIIPLCLLLILYLLYRKKTPNEI
ncbi:MAG: hypothetical protein E7562_05015 [Ruminococcaceae bacterium]|nr:hypothetical protein [Oscillospiraceae bacterium]